MREQGSSTFSVDASGWCLDRLAGLQSVVTPERIRQALAKAGRVNERSCKRTHEVMLWVVLAMGLFTSLPIRQVFKASRRDREGEPTPGRASLCERGINASAVPAGSGEPTPGRSSLCEARQRLGVEPVKPLHADLALDQYCATAGHTRYAGCVL